jgi:predicted metal-dependent hydrolase
MADIGKPLTLSGAPEVEVTLRRSRRARRLSLRVSQLDGRVTLTLPASLPLSSAQDFLRAQDGWLRRQLGGIVQPLTVTDGASLPILGVPHLVRRAPVRAATITASEVLVPERGAVGPRVKAAILLLARARINDRAGHYAARAGRSHGPIALRDTRGRWGSCAANGRLMFSWRLALAPAEVLDYVIAHEVAHLVQMNHSPAFWAEVARLYPGYERPRDWLRQHGSSLHRYRFDAS